MWYDGLERMRRHTIGLLALMLLVTSAVTGAVFHLCGMEGLVRTTCCCHESSDRPPVELKRIDDCCGGVISNGDHPLAAVSKDKPTVDAPMPMLAALVVSECFAAKPAEKARMPLARGSPNHHGPPLFIRNCSYLN
jgi:hypothetical protein